VRGEAQTQGQEEESPQFEEGWPQVTRRLLALATCLMALAALPAAAEADFGIAPGSLRFSAENANGTPDTQAGSHPYAFHVEFELNFDEVAGKTEGGEMRGAITDLPPGMFGNPQAVEACPKKDFEGVLPDCPPGSQVGVLRVILPGASSEAFGPLYNLVAPPGAAAQLGFNAAEFSALLTASVRSEAGYGVRIEAPNLPLEASVVQATIWGTPADPSHNPQRGNLGGEETSAPPTPFFTLPTSCEVPQLTVSVESKLAPGILVPASALLLDAGGNPQAFTGCEAVPFSPSVVAGPSTNASESPSGLGLALKLPNQGLTTQVPTEGESAVTETEPKETVLTLPAGVTANPAAVNGQAVCPRAQFEFQSSCPDASKLGTLVAKSPLLEEPIEGSLYLAAPHENEFNSLLALYIIARAPQRGVLIKQAGKIEADPVTGQLTTTLKALPPVPYSGFEVQLREGPRAPLITPQACGTYTATMALYPFSDPGAPTVREVPFKITTGAGGHACASGEAGLPNTPSFSAGTTHANAGAYSPFVLRLSREDGTQRFSAVTAEPPLGLTAKLAGIPYCPQSGIEQASSRTAEGDGAIELASPSCPAASQVGTVTASAGAGPSPYFVQGKAYLAGPYKGAPLSLEVIVPAIAGPFDLGVVATRAAIYINAETAKITVVSDPLPSILHGIPVDARSVSVQMDRNQFTLNPTNCEPTKVGGSLTSLSGAIAPLMQRFQVGGCQGLAFKPKLSIELKGSTKRTGHPALKATVTYPKGGEYANIARAQVNLPTSEFIDQGNLNKTCTRPVLVAGHCPATSIYGKAKAWTPLLEKPLEGPVYLVGGYGYKLPALVAELNGQIKFLLAGKVDTGPNHGIRNTFEAVPDAPVEKFVLEMKGGKKYSLLENSQNLCAKPQKGIARFIAQSGKVLSLTPTIANSCKNKGKHSKRDGKKS
jgi:hypothetical protein